MPRRRRRWEAVQAGESSNQLGMLLHRVLRVDRHVRDESQLLLRVLESLVADVERQSGVVRDE